jgi:hypothetical protein
VPLPNFEVKTVLLIFIIGIFIILYFAGRKIEKNKTEKNVQRLKLLKSKNILIINAEALFKSGIHKIMVSENGETRLNGAIRVKQPIGIRAPGGHVHVVLPGEFARITWGTGGVLIKIFNFKRKKST